MNDKLKNYTSQPDPEVWEGIEKRLRRRTALRQATTAVAGLALLAVVIVGVVAWPSRQAVPATGSMLVGNEQQSTAQEAAVQTAQDEALPAAAGTASRGSRQMAQGVTQEVAAVMPTTAAQHGAAASAEGAASSAASRMQEPSAAVAAVVGQHGAQAADGAAASSSHKPQPAQGVSQQPAAAVAEVPAGAAATESKPAAVKASQHSRVEDTILWIPNAFMPASDDPVMAVFKPRITVPDASVNNYKMTIFNRGGHVVFTTRDINEGWNGTYHGEAQVQAAYVYVIQYTDRENLQHQTRGTVTLIR